MLCTTRTTSLACVKKGFGEVAANVGPCVVIGLSKFIYLEISFIIAKRVPCDRRYRSCANTFLFA